MNPQDLTAGLAHGLAGAPTFTPAPMSRMDWFAATAPADIPDWFQVTGGPEEPPAVDHEKFVQQDDSYLGLDDDQKWLVLRWLKRPENRLPDKTLEVARRIKARVYEAEEQVALAQRESAAARYISWRWHYARVMLAHPMAHAPVPQMIDPSDIDQPRLKIPQPEAPTPDAPQSLVADPQAGEAHRTDPNDEGSTLD